MKLFFCKKGDTTSLQFMPLLKMVFLALVIIVLFSFAKSWEDSTYLKRNFLAKDLGFTISTLQFSPWDINFRYPQKFEEQRLEVDKSMVSISSLHYMEVVDTTTFRFLRMNGIVVQSLNYPSVSSKKKELVSFDVNIKKVEDSIVLIPEDD